MRRRVLTCVRPQMRRHTATIVAKTTAGTATATAEFETNADGDGAH